MKSITVFKFGDSSLEHYQPKTKSRPHRSFKEVIKSIYQIPNLWIVRTQARKALIKRPDYLLKDMGLTRLEVETEARKPFWEKGIY